MIISQWKSQQYDLLLTNQRLVLIPREMAKTDVRKSVKDFFKHSEQPLNTLAVLINRLVSHEPNEYDRTMGSYEAEGPEKLTLREGSISVPLSAIKEVKLQSGFNGNAIVLKLNSPMNAGRKLRIYLLSPDDFLSRRLTIPLDAIEMVKISGDYANLTLEDVGSIPDQTKAAMEEYLGIVKHTLLSCLPHDVVMRSDGLL